MATDNVTPIRGKDDTQTLTLGEIAAELRQLMESTPQEQWVWVHESFDDTELLLAWMYEHLATGGDGNVHSVAANGTIICATGNGEHARQYARLIMLMKAALPFLLELLDQANQTPLDPEPPREVSLKTLTWDGYEGTFGLGGHKWTIVVHPETHDFSLTGWGDPTKAEVSFAFNWCKPLVEAAFPPLPPGAV